MYERSILLHFIISVFFVTKCMSDKDSVTFSFKEYQYKDSAKNVSIKYLYLHIGLF